MKKLTLGLAVTALFAVPAFLLNLAGCGQPECGCPAPVDIPFPTAGVFELTDVREGDGGVDWDDSSWADVVRGSLTADGDQVFVSVALDDGSSVDATMTITDSYFELDPVE